MVNGAFFSHPRSGDFFLERLYTLFQLLDRQRVEVLDRQLAEQIVLATRKIFVGVHRSRNVDRGRSDVNKAAGSYGARKYP